MFPVLVCWNLSAYFSSAGLACSGAYVQLSLLPEPAQTYAPHPVLPGLSDLTMKRVITGILSMLIVLPALEITSGINGSETPLALGGLHMLHTQAIVGGAETAAFASSLQVGCW